jgi:hypothetical protein
MTFGYVALSDGRLATDGQTFYIRDGYLDEAKRFRVVFDTRIEAIRASAARMLCNARYQARAGRLMRSPFYCTRPMVVELANWTREIVARESGKPTPRPLTVPRLPEPRKPSVTDGLPLFEAAGGRTNE